MRGGEFQLRRVSRRPLGCAKMRFRIFTILTVLACGCSLTYRGTVSSDARYNPHRAALPFKAVRTIAATPTPGLDSGAFYIMQSDGDNPLPSKPMAMIQDLYTRGFDITHVWILDIRGCDTTGRSYRMTTATIYHPFLMIHLEHSDEAILRFKFHETTPRREFLGCPHYVREDLADATK